MNAEQFRSKWLTLIQIASEAQSLSIDDANDLILTVLLAIETPREYPHVWVRTGKKDLNDMRRLAETFLAFRDAIEEVKR